MTLTKYLAAKNLTQGEFAQMVDVAPATVSRWCSGERVPTIEMMGHIQERTGGAIRPNDWLELTEQTAAKKKASMMAAA